MFLDLITFLSNTDSKNLNTINIASRRPQTLKNLYRKTCHFQKPVFFLNFVLSLMAVGCQVIICLLFEQRKHWQQPYQNVCKICYRNLMFQLMLVNVFIYLLSSLDRYIEIFQHWLLFQNISQVYIFEVNGAILWPLQRRLICW